MTFPANRPIQGAMKLEDPDLAFWRGRIVKERFNAVLRQIPTGDEAAIQQDVVVQGKKGGFPQDREVAQHADELRVRADRGGRRRIVRLKQGIGWVTRQFFWV